MYIQCGLFIQLLIADLNGLMSLINVSESQALSQLVCLQPVPLCVLNILHLNKPFSGCQLMIPGRLSVVCEAHIDLSGCLFHFT